jgi:hypothetical protein
VSSPAVEVVTERWRPTIPETEYHKQNLDQIHSFEKDQREKDGRALDKADSFLNRGSISRSGTAVRIWPPHQRDAQAAERKAREARRQKDKEAEQLPAHYLRKS